MSSFLPRQVYHFGIYTSEPADYGLQLCKLWAKLNHSLKFQVLDTLARWQENDYDIIACSLLPKDTVNFQWWPTVPLWPMEAGITWLCGLLQTGGKLFCYLFLLKWLSLFSGSGDEVKAFVQPFCLHFNPLNSTILRTFTLSLVPLP